MSEISAWDGSGAAILRSRDRFETVAGVVLMLSFIGIFVFGSTLSVSGVLPGAVVGLMASSVLAAFTGIITRRPHLAASLSMKQMQAIHRAAICHPEVRQRLDELKASGSPLRLQQYIEVMRVSSSMELQRTSRRPVKSACNEGVGEVG